MEKATSEIQVPTGTLYRRYDGSAKPLYGETARRRLSGSGGGQREHGDLRSEGTGVLRVAFDRHVREFVQKYTEEVCGRCPERSRWVIHVTVSRQLLGRCFCVLPRLAAGP